MVFVLQVSTFFTCKFSEQHNNMDMKKGDKTKRDKTRKSILTIISIALLLGVNSCCTKKACLGADYISEISFYNFTLTELDTIKIYSYSKNSDSTILVDSSVTQAQRLGDYYFARTKDMIKIEQEHKIKITSTGQVYTLTDFETQKKRCNYCFFNRSGSDFYNELKGYFVNGQKQSGREIKIYK